MKNSIKLQFKSDAALLAPVRALVAAYVSGMVPRERAGEITLAVDEACANAIRHAYGNAPDGEITLSLRRDATRLEVVVADKGAPMPAKAAKKGAVSAKSVKKDAGAAALARPGGLGLLLMRRVFDEVHITRGDKRGNRVRMRLRIK